MTLSQALVSDGIRSFLVLQVLLLAMMLYAVIRLPPFTPGGTGDDSRADAARPSAPPMTPVRPLTAPAGAWPQGLPAGTGYGQFPSTAQFPPAGFPAAQYPDSQFAAAQHPDAQFPAGQIPEAQFPSAQFPSAQFPPAQLPVAQFPAAQFPPAQFPPAAGHIGQSAMQVAAGPHGRARSSKTKYVARHVASPEPRTIRRPKVSGSPPWGPAPRPPGYLP
jgi:hypothetical protein